MCCLEVLQQLVSLRKYLLDRDYIKDKDLLLDKIKVSIGFTLIRYLWYFELFYWVEYNLHPHWLIYANDGGAGTCGGIDNYTCVGASTCGCGNSPDGSRQRITSIWLISIKHHKDHLENLWHHQIVHQCLSFIWSIAGKEYIEFLQQLTKCKCRNTTRFYPFKVLHWM